MVYTEPTAFDIIGSAVLLSRTSQPGSFFPVGVTTVIYTFVDNNGNIAICSFQIVVIEGNFYYIS